MPSRALETISLPCLFSRGTGGGYETIRRCDELEYYERLGPRTAAVLTRRCAFKWCALDVLRYMNKEGMDPLDREVDKRMADLILRKDISARHRGGTPSER